MNDYLSDRTEALERETTKVLRVIDRAVEEGKDVADVIAALRLDWLQGVYIQGTTATFVDDVYDKTYFDTEFDMFTYDIGVGKGHGHRSGQQGPGNNRGTGFVVGRGGIGDIGVLRGEPAPADGKRGRYDTATQSGQGLVPSDYEVGLRSSQAEGAYRYDQVADLALTRQVPAKSRQPVAARRQRPAGKGRKARRGAPPKRRASRGQRKVRSARRAPRARRSAGASRSRSGRTYQPKQSYQKTRQISKRTAYDDYAPLPRGGYGYGY